MRVLRLFCLLCCSLFVLGCGEDATGPRPVPTAVSIISGASQQGTVGQALDSALTVFVSDKFRDPVPGVLVRFAAAPGNGSIDPVTQTTGPSGRARATWVLPRSVGSYSVTATAAGLDSLVFSAVAVPALPAVLTLVSGDSQTAATTTPVDGAIVVQVRDGYGNPVSGATVTFEAATGAGAAEPTAARTDSTGRAHAIWTLGSQPGVHFLNVRLDSLHEIKVRARALTRPLPIGLATAEYIGRGPWVGGGETSEEVPLPERPRPAWLSPALDCWHNSLGAVALKEASSSAAVLIDEGQGSCAPESPGPP